MQIFILNASFSHFLPQIIFIFYSIPASIIPACYAFLLNYFKFILKKDLTNLNDMYILIGMKAKYSNINTQIKGATMATNEELKMQIGNIMVRIGDMNCKKLKKMKLPAIPVGRDGALLKIGTKILEISFYKTATKGIIKDAYKINNWNKYVIELADGCTITSRQQDIRLI